MRILAKFYDYVVGVVNTHPRGSVCTVVLILIAAAVFSDFARQSHQQSRLHVALAEGVKAAIAPDRLQSPDQVVASTLAKARLKSPYYLSVAVDESTDFRQVSAQVSGQVETRFLRYLSINSLDLFTTAAAVQPHSVLEIVLLLDTSSTMAKGHRLQNMKAAAKDFAATVLRTTTEQQTLVSVVPFNSSVAMPYSALAALDMATAPPLGGCLAFDADDYGHAELENSTGFTPVVAATRFGSSWGDMSTEWVSCANSYSQQALLFSQDIDAVTYKIEGLVASGGSANHVAMKWATGLFGAAFDGMRSGHDRVRLHETSLKNNEHRRVIVMITDGAPSAEPRFDRRFAEGLAPVWQAQDPAENWVNGAFLGITHNFTTWRSGDSSYEWACDAPDLAVAYTCHYAEGHYAPLDTVFIESEGRFLGVTSQTWVHSLPKGAYQQLTWPAVWGQMSIEYYDRVTGADAAGNWQSVGAIPALETANMFANTCAVAKATGVIVYTVALEAAAMVDIALNNCVSTKNHYYNASSAGGQTALSAIAAQLMNENLTN